MSILYDWAGSVIGQPLNPDGHYGNQCVDTIDHFGEFIFGVPWQQCVGGVVGAKDLLDAAPDEYWERIDYYHGFVPRQFDVLVYGGDSLNQWGHTAVTWYADPNASTINVIQQDGFAYPWQFVDGNYYSAKPAHYYTLHYSQAGTGPLMGVLRPRAHKLIGSVVPAGEVTTPTPVTEEDDMFSDDDRKLLTAVKEALIDGGKSMLYGASIQKLIDDIPRRTAFFPVIRDGEKVAWIQDTANGVTMLEDLQDKVLPAMAEALKLDPDAVRAAFEEAVKGSKLTVTIGGEDN